MAEVKHMLVVSSALEAEGLRRQIGSRAVSTRLADSNPDFYVTYPGASLLGRKVAGILLSRELYAELSYPDSSSTQQSNHRWWRESALCRVVVGGQIIVL